MPRRSPVRRRLLRWFAAQIAASAWLTTCVAYAMAPATLKPLPDDMTYALRFSRADEAPHPLPASLQDGFRLRLSFVDGAE
ncbi:hypothetical protein [Methylobacterium nigriterrae]|uniref:hypothetical protein n=1 Tax=Methylobacterium nigriterrae TaxID=3127512 RepID=UPI003013459D